jgi:hypothetical protein
MSFDFDNDLQSTKKIERRIFWKEVLALAVIGCLIAARQLWLL